VKEDDEERPTGAPAKRTVSGVRSVVAVTSGRVLLIDQYPDWLNFMGFILRRRGHDVFCARTAEVAREILQAEPLQVIASGLLDEGGLKVLLAAKARGSIRNIVLSRDGSEIRGLPRGTVDMPLLRPVPILSLVEAIESFLPLSGQRLG